MSKARPKGTTPKALPFKMKQQGTTNNNGGGESSFRVLYYGDASAGSVPFLWESHPGTPKHPTTESSLPPFTPPPAFRQFSKKYNSPKQSSSLRSLFLAASSRKTQVPAVPQSSMSDSSVSYDSSSKQSTSLRSLFLASSSRKTHVTVAAPSYSSLSRSLTSTSMSKGQGKTEFRGQRVGVEDGGEKQEGGGGGSSTSTLCFGGVLMKVYRMTKVKNALMSIGGHGKIEKII